MNYLKNLKIRSKLRLPLILQLVLLFIFGYYFYSVSSQFATEKIARQSITEMAAKIRNFSDSIDKYLEQKGQMTLEQLNSEYSTILNAFNTDSTLNDSSRIETLKNLESELKKIEAIFTANENIEKEVFQLLDLSVKQSNDFINQLSRKLADSEKRNSVSTLERRVIEGALVNTTASFQLKVLFLQTKANPEVGSGLIEFIDQLLQNVETDIKRLAKTQFLSMAQTAKDANLKTKELCTTFLENLKNFDTSKQHLMTYFNDVFHYITQMEEKNTSHIFNLINNVFLKLFVYIIAIIILIAIFTTILARWIANPLQAMIERAYDLAVGDVDMTQRLQVDSKDELGELAQWFNKFLERLQQLIIKVKTGSTHVHKATEEIRRSSEELASRTNQQAASITETSATVEQFTSATKQNTENSAEADMMLVEFNSEIQEKSGLIDNVTETMTEIFDSSKQIDNIIKVINDISFQTNLLALNAAVEAARAGEAGRGFAVVASEVRNLAQKTAESSKSIQDIVIRNVESTQKGMELVKATSEFFGEIVGVMGDIVTKISNITNVSREQATGLEQINLAIGQMDIVSSQNADLVQQLHDTGKGVESNAVELQDLVSQFKIDGSSDIKGSNYYKEVVQKKKQDKKAHKKDSENKKDKEKERPKDKDKNKEKENISRTRTKSQSAPAVTEKKEKKKTPSTSSPAITRRTPTEEDFFGSDDDGFEEF